MGPQGSSAEMIEGDEHNPIEEDLFIGDDADFLEGDLDEDIDIVDDGSNMDSETKRFDQLVGALEDVLLDEEFENERLSFCRQHCHHFEDSGENKLIYMDIFQRYTQLVETGIESRLSEAVVAFDMQSFLTTLDNKKDELMSEVFDLLLSMGDFEVFKDLMLSYKQEMAGEGALGGFSLQCCSMKIHTEEQEDGEERPDLDLGLTISPVGGGPGHKSAFKSH